LRRERRKENARLFPERKKRRTSSYRRRGGVSCEDCEALVRRRGKKEPSLSQRGEFALQGEFLKFHAY